MAKLKTLQSGLAVLGQRLQTINPESWRAGKTTAERGYGARWQKVRATFLASHPLCAMCAAQGFIVVATVVDHIVPHMGNQTLFWDENNWQPLCASHHSSDKQREERGGAG